MNNVLTLLRYAANDEVQVIPAVPVTIKHFKVAPAEVEYYEPDIYEASSPSPASSTSGRT